MNKCRETNPVSWYKTAITCLTDLYVQLEEESGGAADPSCEGWPDLRELAKKFVLSLGFDSIKIRQPLVGLHRSGMMIAGR